ncbi:MAG TPA: hypothetical protein ENG87_04015 [Candidatus Pacearchaeota archaeon]|nr:hypothetical protein [Candidatus Pacearchaeota archaeon]HDZ61197.1 hypothetical protein [Candidatus Pacearchaeota archaeon]
MKIKIKATALSRKNKLEFLLENEISLYCMKHKKVLTYEDILNHKCYKDKAFKSTYCLDLRGHGEE